MINRLVSLRKPAGFLLGVSLNRGRIERTARLTIADFFNISLKLCTFSGSYTHGWIVGYRFLA